MWTALIAMLLLLKYLQLKSKFSWSLSMLAALLPQQLFFYRDLWVWLDDPFQARRPWPGCTMMRNSLKSRRRRQFGQQENGPKKATLIPGGM